MGRGKCELQGREFAGGPVILLLGEWEMIVALGMQPVGKVGKVLYFFPLEKGRLRAP